MSIHSFLQGIRCIECTLISTPGSNPPASHIELSLLILLTCWGVFSGRHGCQMWTDIPSAVLSSTRSCLINRYTPHHRLLCSFWIVHMSLFCPLPLPPAPPASWSSPHSRRVYSSLVLKLCFLLKGSFSWPLLLGQCGFMKSKSWNEVGKKAWASSLLKSNFHYLGKSSVLTNIASSPCILIDSPEMLCNKYET